MGTSTRLLRNTGVIGSAPIALNTVPVAGLFSSINCRFSSMIPTLAVKDTRFEIFILKLFLQEIRL